MSIKVLGIFTCYNRKEKTVYCLKSLMENNPQIEFSFIAVDDASTDGTKESLKKISCVEVLEGNGQLFYSGGMRKGIAFAKEKKKEFDYCLFFNDDVEFISNSIEKMLIYGKDKIIVGATCDANGNLSYGGVKRISTFRPKFRTIMGDNCDAFNANCVLIPWDMFLMLPNIDPAYVHSMGDFDYGLEAKKHGCEMYTTDFFVGICNDNPIKKTWRDTSLNRKERIRLKENRKGLPTKEWFHFVKKHFGFLSACYSVIIPYIRIILGR